MILAHALPQICTVCQQIALGGGCRCDNRDVVVDLTPDNQALVQVGRVIERRLRVDARYVTYLARHHTLGRREVVCVVEDNRIRREELLRRARLFGRLRSDRAARIHDVVAPGDERADLVEAPLIFIEHVEGEPLDAYMARGPIEPALALRFVIDLCDPLAELHATGEVFGVLHPRLAVVESVGDGIERVKLAEFGMGDAPTPPYAAPHRATRPDLRDDVFALGALLALMLMAPADRPQTIGSADVAALPASGRLRDALRRMIGPRARCYAHAAEVADALRSVLHAEAVRRESAVDPLLDTSPSAAVRAPISDEFARPDLGAGRRRLALGLAALAAVALIGGHLVSSTDDAPASTEGAAAAVGSTDDVAPEPVANSPAATAEAAEKLDSAEAPEPAPVGRPGAARSADPPRPPPAPADVARPTPARSAPVVTPPPFDWPTLPPVRAPRIPLGHTPVTVAGTPLYVARREITATQWRQLTGGSGPQGVGGHGQQPVIGLNLCEAAWFANQLSAAEGLSTCYASLSAAAADDCRQPPRPQRPCDGYRLPSEREWAAIAKAARLDPAREAGRVRIHPGSDTCTAPADALGLCELYGGVWEWTETRRNRRDYVRVGGSWERDHRKLFDRPHANHADVGGNYLGMRPVRAISEPPVRLGALVVDLYADDLRGPAGRAPLGPYRDLLRALVERRGTVARPDFTPEQLDALGAALGRVGLPDALELTAGSITLRPPARQSAK